MRGKPSCAAFPSSPRPWSPPWVPRGRNAVIDKGWGGPTVTKDGVSVAEEIELENSFENMGVKLVKEAASKTSDVAGDGTTTATLLTHRIIEEGMKHLTAGSNHAELIRGIRAAGAALVDELKRVAQPVPGGDKKAIEQVATIASNNDPRSARSSPTRWGRSARTA